MERSDSGIATISDVAKTAGVSTATVSHVLNKTRYVSEDLTKRVNDAVKQLGYYPNHLVGGLRKKKSFTIGLMIPHISNETLGGLAEQIQRKLLEYGENLIICNTSYDTAIEDTALSTLIMKKVDAIISIPTSDRATRLLEIQSLGIPVILIDRSIEGFASDSVVIDNQTGAMMAMRHLIELGHRNICFIDRKTRQSHSDAQREGYYQALAAAGITERYVVTADGFDYDAGRRAARKALETMPEITAFFGYYDVVAFGAIRGVKELGKRVPEDISIVGYDAMPFAMAASPRLTSVKFPVAEIAQKVYELVALRLKEKELRDSVASPVRNIVITPELIVGESTNKC